MDKTLILVVEDDLPVQNLITVTLKAEGYRYLTAQTGQAAVITAATHNPDIILLDLGLPDLDGVDTVEQQISIAKSKAGIAEWDRNVQLQRFEVVRHH